MSSARTWLASILTAAAVALAACGQAPEPAKPAAPPAPAAPAPQADASAATQPAQPPAVGGLGNDVDVPPAITDADIPPLPVTPFMAARPMEIVRAVYVFAAKHPEVLNKIPCFCGCEHRGHRHNDDCFVSARDDRGRPTVWEPHGVG